MSRRAQQLIELLEPSVTALGYQLVDLEYNPSAKHGMLRIYIDHANGISVEDCASVSHQVSGVLDVEDVIQGEYNLEISSPGLDRVLRTLEHYQDFMGCEIVTRIKRALNGQRKFTGVLSAVDDEYITLKIGDEEIELKFENIEKTRLVPDFNT